MAYLYPCKHCALSNASCERRESVRAAFKGLSITSAKFKCSQRTPLFHSGQRVKFTWRIYEDVDCYGQASEVPTEFSGTISHEKKNRFVVKVDQVENIDEFHPKDAFKNGGKFVPVRPADITAINEPDQPICRTCGAYEGEIDPCHRSTFHHNLPGCFLASSRKSESDQ